VLASERLIQALAPGRSRCCLACVLACNPSAPHTHADELSFHRDIPHTPDTLASCPPPALATVPHPNPIPIHSPYPCRSTPTPARCAPRWRPPSMPRATSIGSPLSIHEWPLTLKTTWNMCNMKPECNIHLKYSCNICETHMQHPKRTLATWKHLLCCCNIYVELYNIHIKKRLQQYVRDI
jgi:hypothetical protein